MHHEYGPVEIILEVLVWSVDGRGSASERVGYIGAQQAREGEGLHNHVAV